MKIIFMGTPDFSVPTLDTLIKSKHEVLVVVTQPDQPKGRGNKMTFTPVKEKALEHNIPVLQPKRVKENDFLQQIKTLEPDAIVVIAFGQILPKKLLDLPKYGCINVHASLLPKYRGAGPIQWSVINGESVTGITTMFMDVGLDTGDMLLKTEVKLAPNETGGSLHDKLSEMGGPLLLETLDKLENGTLIRIPQNNEKATYAPMLDKNLGLINWHKDAEVIERLIRGLSPWPSAYTYLDNKLLKIWSAEVVEHTDNIEPGTICSIDKNKGFTVKCGINALIIKELQLQGKKKMDTPAFLRGINLENGMRLGHNE